MIKTEKLDLEMRLFAESAENFAISTVTATRRPATPEPVMPPTERIAALSLADPEVNPATQRLNRILATLLERQLDTDECIEISNVTWRTARYRYLLYCFFSVVDPNILNWDPDPDFWPSLDPDPGL